jgi:hypothetical protein
MIAFFALWMWLNGQQTVNAVDLSGVVTKPNITLNSDDGVWVWFTPSAKTLSKPKKMVLNDQDIGCWLQDDGFVRCVDAQGRNRTVPLDANGMRGGCGTHENAMPTTQPKQPPPSDPESKARWVRQTPGKPSVVKLGTNLAPKLGV